MRLRGMTAVITGSSRGIGKAIALGFARQGARVVVHCATQIAAAEATAADIRAAGGEAVVVQADLADPARCRDIISAALNAFGRIDVLVNNAGMAIRQALLEVTPEAWDLVTNVNLKSVYFLSQAAARDMLLRGSGKIINISSVHDAVPMANNSVYCIAKAGLVMLTKALALELAPRGIQVNCISPGAILTDENRDRLADPAYRARVLAKIPAGRIGIPEDVVGAAVLLASREADYVTGATLYVDGGMLLY